MFSGSSLKGQTLYNVPPSVENLRIDVEKCVNEHSEQMLMLLALLQDNRRRRGSVTDEANKDGEDEENGEVKEEKAKKRGRKNKRRDSGRGLSGVQVFSYPSPPIGML